MLGKEVRNHATTATPIADVPIADVPIADVIDDDRGSVGRHLWRGKAVCEFGLLGIGSRNSLLVLPRNPECRISRADARREACDLSLSHIGPKIRVPLRKPA